MTAAVASFAVLDFGRWEDKQALAQLKNYARVGINLIHAAFVESDLVEPAAVQFIDSDTDFYNFDFTYGSMCGNIRAHRNGDQLVRPYFDITAGGFETQESIPYLVQSARIQNKGEDDMLVQDVLQFLEACHKKYVPPKCATMC